ncbi:DNA-binding XRE family transcriptional regulator [Hoeflea halophila]|uniref:DNA-binding XRE family transcriptional regulator n=1 Tax=Hoeflea halophila TaxID=714899 RepID=A0A286IAS0_9HYPH|nr:helix-turn-helix transcriptional regulator [Hoeflea halophila]SOE17161.1 DNA-binding XRE family transcriptional regulator [Hoeflea halophila]
MESLDSFLVQTFARNLKRLRSKAGMSQEELALKSGLDRTYVSGCERGVRNPSLVSVEKVASALGVRVEELFVGAS